MAARSICDCQRGAFCRRGVATTTGKEMRWPEATGLKNQRELKPSSTWAPLRQRQLKPGRISRVIATTLAYSPSPHLTYCIEAGALHRPCALAETKCRNHMSSASCARSVGMVE